jgi:hypothetical protein
MGVSAGVAVSSGEGLGLADGDGDGDGLGDAWRFDFFFGERLGDGVLFALCRR